MQTMARHFCLFILLCVVSIAVIAQSHTFRYYSGSYEDLLALALQTNRPIFLAFSYPECQDCKSMESQVSKDPLFRDFVYQNFIPFQINVNADPHSAELAKAYHIEVFPSVVVLNSWAQEIRRWEGKPDPYRFNTEIAHAIGLEPVQTLRHETKPNATSVSVITKKGTQKINIQPSNKPFHSRRKMEIRQILNQYPIRQHERDFHSPVTTPTLKETKPSRLLTSSDPYFHGVNEPMRETTASETLFASAGINDISLYVPGMEEYSLYQMKQSGYGLLIGNYSSMLTLRKELDKLNSSWKQKIWVFSMTIQGNLTYHLVLGTFDSESSASFYQQAISEQFARQNPKILDLGSLKSRALQLKYTERSANGK